MSAQLLSGPLGIELRVTFHCLDQPIIAAHRSVVFEDVDDKALLNRLLHGVGVEGQMPPRPLHLRTGVPEDLQGFVLGSRGEGEVAGVGQESSRFHQPVEGQEPRVLAAKMGAEPYLVVVDGEGGKAAAEGEEFLLGFAVAPVLLDCVFHRLLGKAVLQLKGGDR